jgi:hypothetical protein
MIGSFTAYAIGLAAVVLLLAIPSTARAGYPDGMNSYAGYHVMHGGLDPSGLWTRENDAGHVWCAENGDTLWGLAARQEYGGNGQNWPCLWPTEDTTDHGYPNTIHPGDKYDASNLAVPAPSATSLRVGAARDLYADHRIHYGLSSYMRGDQVPAEIQRVSGEGATPLSVLVVTGHSGRSGIGGQKLKGKNKGYWFMFRIFELVRLSQAPSFARAQQKKGPVRCWFTRDATARFSGCNTRFTAEPFAATVLRRGGTAYGTDRKVGHSSSEILWDPIYNDEGKHTGWGERDEDVLSAPIWNSYPGEL